MLPAYEVECLLGRGGMGAVYRAQQRSLKRSVAIKVLPRSSADDELKFAERFRHEAETLARLNHPGSSTSTISGKHRTDCSTS